MLTRQETLVGRLGKLSAVHVNRVLEMYNLAAWLIDSGGLGKETPEANDLTSFLWQNALSREVQVGEYDYFERKNMLGF